MSMNRTVRLARRPQGLPPVDTWTIADEPVPAPAEGEVLVRVKAISLDPAMRGWINEGRSYIPPVQLGEVMRAGAVGEVLESRHPDFAAGDAVAGGFGVQRYAVARGADLERIDLSVADWPTWLGVLGMPGMTAYFGILDVGALKDGETVVVSAAAGAVGALVGQIAKLHGCRVVGIAGGQQKCRYVVEELGFDAAIDYREGDVLRRLAEAVPGGIDIYFDNVGGETLEAAMSLIRRGARVVICGAISGYNDFTKIQGPRNYLNLLVQRARMEGFIVFDYADRYPEAKARIAGWLREGKVKAREDVQHGIDRFPEVLNMLYTSQNFGKLVLVP
jgi:NADPH-dependent curcumin reductase CurA